MSYFVELRQKAAETISGSRPSSHAIREILQGLDRLASNPNQFLIRIGPPYDVLMYDLIVDDPAKPHLDFLYSFTVRYGADEETLIVVDCDLLVEERPPQDLDDDPT